MSLLQNSNAISAGGYDINNSLRFRNSASAYLSRTPASAGNRRTWTLSAWVKRGQLGSIQHILDATVATNNNNWFSLSFNSDDTLALTMGYNFNYYGTSAKYRDPSAWYHIILAFDSTQATFANRFKIYVNGVQQTMVLTYSDVGGDMPQNHDTPINNTVSHALFGKYQYGNARYFDGYLAEVNFIDGQALTPSSFGETDATTGSWVAKKYTGTYGTNGFYLKFSDIATTSGSNAGLGKDFSGNTNYWTTNNISVTSGTTYDAMTDSPTLTSATVANYAVLNPIDTSNWLSQNGTITLSNGNLTFTSSSAGAMTEGSLFVSSGKWYYEFTVASSNTMIGIRSVRALYNGDITYRYYTNTGEITFCAYNSTSPSLVTTVASATSGDIIGVAFNLDSNTISWYKNNTLLYTLTGAVSDTYTAGVGGAAVATGSINFGQRPFTYTPPTGYKALNTYNLPDSTIKKGNNYMDAVLYTGNGISGRAVNTTTGFRPDFAWAKSRDVSGSSNILTDSNRGNTKYLISESTAAEGTAADLTFTSTGVTWNDGVSLNGNGYSYVNWFWQAGQGSTSSNTNGYITSTVSVNTTAGFSIVTYTGNLTASPSGGNDTVGHGLGVAPKMIIFKRRDGASSWMVWHTSLASVSHVLQLNQTDAQINSATAAGWLGGTPSTPTSTIFGTNYITGRNVSGQTHVAYCWAEIAGFSKFGSYTGNGSTDGPFVYLGFRPKFIMIKRYDAGGENWTILDTSVNTYNLTYLQLFPNASTAETNGSGRSPAVQFDYLSNGFKLRGANGEVNGSGWSYIYAAFAENPFKNANAR